MCTCKSMLHCKMEMHKYLHDLLVTITVNQLLFACKKCSRGLREPHWQEYILPYNRPVVLVWSL